MSDRGTPKCWSCGYELAELAAGTECPECGTQTSDTAFDRARRIGFTPSQLRVHGVFAAIAVLVFNWLGMLYAAYVFHEARKAMKLVRAGHIREEGARQVSFAYWVSGISVGIGCAFLIGLVVMLAVTGLA